MPEVFTSDVAEIVTGVCHVTLGCALARVPPKANRNAKPALITLCWISEACVNAQLQRNLQPKKQDFLLGFIRSLVEDFFQSLDFGSEVGAASPKFHTILQIQNPPSALSNFFKSPLLDFDLGIVVPQEKREFVFKRPIAAELRSRWLSRVPAGGQEME